MASFLLIAAFTIEIGAAVSDAHEGQGVCDDLEQIREIPIKQGWSVDDGAYNRLISHGVAATACLVARIADETSMPDPRQEPTKQGDFKVGDLAFFLLLDLGIVKYNEVLPPRLASTSVQEYFRWVNLPGNRRELQENCAVAAGLRAKPRPD